MANKVIEIKQYRFPTNLYYTDRHLWFRKESDGSVISGIDDLGQKLAGKIVAIRLPAESVALEPGKIFGTMESGKWIERLRSAITGTVRGVNTQLGSTPSLVNEDPYGNGWLIRIMPTANVDQELGKLATGGSLEGWVRKEIEEKEGLSRKKL